MFHFYWTHIYNCKNITFLFRNKCATPMGFSNLKKLFILFCQVIYIFEISQFINRPDYKITLSGTPAHPCSKPVELVFPVPAPPSSIKRVVFHFIPPHREGTLKGHRKLFQILHEDDATFTKRSSNWCVVCQGNLLFLTWPCHACR